MPAVPVVSHARTAPPVTLRETAELPVFDAPWWLVHTKSRQEKALAWDLFDGGIDYFLPIVIRRRLHGGRPAEVPIALFPGYVFVSGTRSGAIERVYRTHRAASVTEVVDQRRLQRELEQVYRAIRSPHSVDLYPGLKRGRRCVVLSGALKGLEGVVVRRGSCARLYVEMTLLGQSAAVEIDADALAPIDD